MIKGRHNIKTDFIILEIVKNTDNVDVEKWGAVMTAKTTVRTSWTGVFLKKL